MKTQNISSIESVNAVVNPNAEAIAHAKAVFVKIRLNDKDYDDDYVIWTRPAKGNSPEGFKALQADEECYGAGWDVMLDEDGEEIEMSKTTAKVAVVLWEEGNYSAQEAVDEAFRLTFEMAKDARLMKSIARKEREQRDLEMSRALSTKTVTKVVNGRIESSTTSSAPINTPISVEHTFEGDESGRSADVQGEGAATIETGISESASATEAVPTDSSAVDERIKAAKAEQLKQAKANAKAIEESEKMTADIMAQVAEVRRMLEEAKEAKRLEEERRMAEERERQTLAEVEAINKATEESKAQTDAALAEQRKQQEDALRMILEMKKELESLKA